MKTKISVKFLLTVTVVLVIVVTALIPARIASLRPLNVETTLSAQEQDPMQMMMLIMMLIMMLGQMNQGKQNNELRGEPKEAQDNATENMLKELYGINNQEQPS